MSTKVMFSSVMLVQLSPCRNDSPSPLPRLYRECRHRSRGTTVNAVPIPAITAVSVIKSNPITAVGETDYAAKNHRSRPWRNLYTSTSVLDLSLCWTGSHCSLRNTVVAYSDLLVPNRASTFCNLHPVTVSFWSAGVLQQLSLAVRTKNL